VASGCCQAQWRFAGWRLRFWLARRFQRCDSSSPKLAALKPRPWQNPYRTQLGGALVPISHSGTYVNEVPYPACYQQAQSFLKPNAAVSPRQLQPGLKFVF
jgi:hypothetical protein